MATQRPRQMSLADCVRQGDTILHIYCITERVGKKAQYGGGPNVCGHHGQMPVDQAIAKWGVETSLSDLRGLRCSVCGGADVQIQADGPTNAAGRRVRRVT